MERIVIVTACDDKYAQYCGVLITSIFDNNKENNVIVNILTDYISDENRNLMQQLERMYGRNINIINIDNANNIKHIKNKINNKKNLKYEKSKNNKIDLNKLAEQLFK